jgi:V/A-type H+-transporting ATPase subunit F
MSGKVIAIIGDRETIMPFLATGAEVVYIQKGEGKKVVEDLITEGYKIIFFTENYIEELNEVLVQYRSHTVPCLIPVPTGRGKTPLAVERIRGVIKKAVGADVFVEDK